MSAQVMDRGYDPREKDAKTSQKARDTQRKREEAQAARMNVQIASTLSPYPPPNAHLFPAPIKLSGTSPEATDPIAERMRRVFGDFEESLRSSSSGGGQTVLPSQQSISESTLVNGANRRGYDNSDDFEIEEAQREYRNRFRSQGSQQQAGRDKDRERGKLENGRDKSWRPGDYHPQAKQLPLGSSAHRPWSHSDTTDTYSDRHSMRHHLQKQRAALQLAHEVAHGYDDPNGFPPRNGSNGSNRSPVNSSYEDMDLEEPFPSYSATNVDTLNMSEIEQIIHEMKDVAAASVISPVSSPSAAPRSPSSGGAESASDRLKDWGLEVSESEEDSSDAEMEEEEPIPVVPPPPEIPPPLPPPPSETQHESPPNSDEFPGWSLNQILQRAGMTSRVDSPLISQTSRPVTPMPPSRTEEAVTPIPQPVANKSVSPSPVPEKTVLVETAQASPRSISEKMTSESAEERKLKSPRKPDSSLGPKEKQQSAAVREIVQRKTTPVRSVENPRTPPPSARSAESMAENHAGKPLLPTPALELTLKAENSSKLARASSPSASSAEKLNGLSTSRRSSPNKILDTTTVSLPKEKIKTRKISRKNLLKIKTRLKLGNIHRSMLTVRFPLNLLERIPPKPPKIIPNIVEKEKMAKHPAKISSADLVSIVSPSKSTTPPSGSLKLTLKVKPKLLPVIAQDNLSMLTPPSAKCPEEDGKIRPKTSWEEGGKKSKKSGKVRSIQPVVGRYEEVFGARRGNVEMEKKRMGSVKGSAEEQAEPVENLTFSDRPLDLKVVPKKPRQDLLPTKAGADSIAVADMPQDLSRKASLKTDIPPTTEPIPLPAEPSLPPKTLENGSTHSNISRPKKSRRDSRNDPTTTDSIPANVIPIKNHKKLQNGPKESCNPKTDEGEKDVWKKNEKAKGYAELACAAMEKAVRASEKAGTGKLPEMRQVNGEKLVEMNSESRKRKRSGEEEEEKQPKRVLLDSLLAKVEAVRSATGKEGKKSAESSPDKSSVEKKVETVPEKKLEKTAGKVLENGEVRSPSKRKESADNTETAEKPKISGKKRKDSPDVPKTEDVAFSQSVEKRKDGDESREKRKEKSRKEEENKSVRRRPQPVPAVEMVKTADVRIKSSKCTPALPAVSADSTDGDVPVSKCSSRPSRGTDTLPTPKPTPPNNPPTLIPNEKDERKKVTIIAVTAVARAPATPSLPPSTTTPASTPFRGDPTAEDVWNRIHASLDPLDMTPDFDVQRALARALKSEADTLDKKEPAGKRAAIYLQSVVHFALMGRSMDKNPPHAIDIYRSTMSMLGPPRQSAPPSEESSLLIKVARYLHFRALALLSVKIYSFNEEKVYRHGRNLEHQRKSVPSSSSSSRLPIPAPTKSPSPSPGTSASPYSVGSTSSGSDKLSQTSTSLPNPYSSSSDPPTTNIPPQPLQPPHLQSALEYHQLSWPLTNGMWHWNRSKEALAGEPSALVMQFEEWLQKKSPLGLDGDIDRLAQHLYVALWVLRALPGS